MSVPARVDERIPTTYGWSAEGKTPAEITKDIRQTRYRLDAELDALREKIAGIKWPAAGAAALAVVAILIRKLRR